MGVFSKNYHQIVDTILTDCTVFQPVPLDGKHAYPKSYKSTKAAWDTGADASYISPRLVEVLGLHSQGLAQVDGATGSDKSQVYLAHVMLPDGSIIPEVELTVLPKMEYDILIGMDIISICDFCFTNKNGESLFSYRIPSAEHIELK